MTRRTPRSFVALGVTLALGLGVVGAGHANAYPRPGVTTRVDVAPDGSQARVDTATLGCSSTTCDGESMISGDGRYVAFSSFASNLVPGDADHGADVFVRDLKTGTTTIASVSSSGQQQIWVDPHLTQINGLAISAHGRYVAFASRATNLTPGDTNVANDVFVHDMSTGTTTRVDVSSAGAQASTGVGYGLSMSSDGRYIAFVSAAGELVSGDANAADDVFTHDMKTGVTRLVSMSSGNAEGDAGSGYGLSLSPTGRYVAFASDATNLVPGDSNQQRDVFLRDTQKNTTEMLSVRPDGSEVPPLGGNSSVAIGAGSSVSADGRYVVFSSNSSFLVPNDSNGQNSDWFVRDRQTARTERVSVASDGTDRAISSAGEAAITPDGAYVVFRTAENLVPADRGICATGSPAGGDTDTDTYVHDLRTGATELVSQSSDGAHASATAADDPSGCQSSQAGTISDDGLTVAFVSTASNLVPGDTNRLTDIFVRERGSALGVGGFRQSHGSSSQSPAPDPVACVNGVCIPPCVNGICPPPIARDATIAGASVAYRPQYADLFVRLDVQHMPTYALADPALVYGLKFTIASTTYQVRIAKPGLEASYQLFRLDRATWTRIAELRGGYGTTGQSVVAALPLADLGVTRGPHLNNVVAFTGLGNGRTGSANTIDEETL